MALFCAIHQISPMCWEIIGRQPRRRSAELGKCTTWRLSCLSTTVIHSRYSTVRYYCRRPLSGPLRCSKMWVRCLGCRTYGGISLGVVVRPASASRIDWISLSCGGERCGYFRICRVMDVQRSAMAFIWIQVGFSFHNYGNRFITRWWEIVPGQRIVFWLAFGLALLQNANKVFT